MITTTLLNVDVAAKWRINYNIKISKLFISTGYLAISFKMSTEYEISRYGLTQIMPRAEHQILMKFGPQTLIRIDVAMLRLPRTMMQI
jgi:hypothetical protein